MEEKSFFKTQSRLLKIRGEVKFIVIDIVVQTHIDSFYN